jgi:hypothetical protein
VHLLLLLLLLLLVGLWKAAGTAAGLLGPAPPAAPASNLHVPAPLLQAC